MEASRSRPEYGVSAREQKFFKITTAHDANKLRIPDEFIQRYGRNLPKSVLLRVPDDGLWNVNVIESNGETWLENGWKGFWDHHSITIGKFLLFDYNGKSLFNVDILDLSASEIECQVASFADQEEATYVNVAVERLVPEHEDADPESDNDSVVFIEAIKSSKKRIDKGKWKGLEKRDQEKEKPPSLKKMSDCSNHGDEMGKEKKMASGMRCISPEEKHDSGPKPCSSSIQIDKSNQQKSTSGLGSRKLKRKIKDRSSYERSIETDDDSETEESDSELDNSSCPKIVIVLEDYSRQPVPVDFTEKVGLMNAKSMTLEYPPKQRYWSVLLEKWPRRDPIRLNLAAGWSKFCKENGLLISKSYSLVYNAAKNVIQVEPVNQTEDDVQERKRKRPAVRNLSPEITKRTEETATVYKKRSAAYKEARAYRADNAIPGLSFVSFLQPSYVHGTRLAIPMSIVRDNFPDSRNKIKLRLSDGKTWPAECVYIQTNGFLTTGWEKFREKNELKVGDACVFELEKSDKHVWNVTIFRS